MITLRCQPAAGPATEVMIGCGSRAAVAARAGARRPFVLIDERLDAAAAGVGAPAWHRLALPGGEASKTLATAETVLRAMARAGLDRTGLLIAAGGGSLGDLGGLCAALFLRGIEVWQLPTTLLAMVDSAVGGKTAVNLPEGKNLVGRVHAPTLVVADPEFAAGLPEREFDSGLAEALKVAIGLDAELFELLAAERARVRRRDPALLEQIVRHCLAAKIAIVAGDPDERGARRLLNLGHTIGHALEALAGGGRPHGHCVARGLHFALDIAAAEGAMDAGDLRRARDLLVAYGHERDALPPAAELGPFVRRDKKVEGDMLHFVLPVGIGRSSVRPVAVDELLAGPGFR